MTECELCCGTGLVDAVAHDASARTLMRCSCPQGEAEIRKLPRFSPRWKEQFSIQQLVRNYASPTEESNVNQKVSEWQARVQVAEEFWRHHDDHKTWGPVFEPPQPKRWDTKDGE